jgi:hypothetical protein
MGDPQRLVRQTMNVRCLSIPRLYERDTVRLVEDRTVFYLVWEHGADSD